MGFVWLVNFIMSFAPQPAFVDRSPVAHVYDQPYSMSHDVVIVNGKRVETYCKTYGDTREYSVFYSK